MILVLVVSCIFVVPVSAADITISVERESIQSRMILSVYQNITRLPSQTATITNSNDPNAFNSFKQAINAINPSATLSDLTIRLDSSTNWLNLSIAMRLSGVAGRHGDVSAVNMSWKAFKVSADLQSGDLGYNLIGKRYFRPVYEYYANASKYVSSPYTTITGVSFFTNKTETVSGEKAISGAGNATLLDFRCLRPSLEQWARTYSLSNNTTTWRYSPPALLADSIKILEGNRTKQILSRYGYSAEIVVPGLARASGDTLLMDVGSGLQEWLMAGVVFLAIAFALVAQVLFRTKKKKLWRMGRK
jgi:hypothetical protein